VREDILPKRFIQFCGSDCSQCRTYQRFLAGDESGVVNAESQYRCCWLPKDYPRGHDCVFRTCCEEKGIMFCGECDQFAECVRVREFYSQPGYDELRKRMLDAITRRR
jgi:hypothetical protein